MSVYFHMSSFGAELQRIRQSAGLPHASRHDPTAAVYPRLDTSAPATEFSDGEEILGSPSAARGLNITDARSKEVAAASRARRKRRSSMPALESDARRQSTSSATIPGSTNAVQSGIGASDAPDGQVQVAVRIRPLIGLEQDRGATQHAWAVRREADGSRVIAEEEHDDSAMTTQERSEAGIFRGQKYRFDDRLLFGPDSTNEELFNQLAASMLPRVLQGYNATILAYG